MSHQFLYLPLHQPAVGHGRTWGYTGVWIGLVWTVLCSWFAKIFVGAVQGVPPPPPPIHKTSKMIVLFLFFFLLFIPFSFFFFLFIPWDISRKLPSRRWGFFLWFILSIFNYSKSSTLEQTLKENNVIITFIFGLNGGVSFCCPYPPAGSEWKRKGTTEFRRRVLINEVIFKRQAKNPKFSNNSSWWSRNKTTIQDLTLIRDKMICKKVVQISSLRHSCGAP